MINWDEIVQDILSGVAVLAVGGLGGWFTRMFFKEKKDSSKIINEGGLTLPSFK